MLFIFKLNNNVSIWRSIIISEGVCTHMNKIKKKYITNANAKN